MDLELKLKNKETIFECNRNGQVILCKWAFPLQFQTLKDADICINLRLIMP